MPLKPKKTSTSKKTSTKRPKYFPKIKRLVKEYGTDDGVLISIEVKDVPFGIGDITIYHNPKIDSWKYTQIGKKGRHLSRCDEGTKRVIFNVLNDQIGDMSYQERKNSYNSKTVTLAYIDNELEKMESFKRKGDAWYMKTEFLRDVRKHLTANKPISDYEINFIFDTVTNPYVGYYETNIDPFPASTLEALSKIKKLLKIY